MIIEQINNLIEETSQPGVVGSFIKGLTSNRGIMPKIGHHTEQFKLAKKGSRDISGNYRKSYHAGAIAADAAKIGAAGAVVAGVGMKGKEEYDKHQRQKKLDKFFDNYDRARKIVQDSDVARKHVKEFRRWLDR